jgi:hypothetical protein
MPSNGVHGDQAAADEGGEMFADRGRTYAGQLGELPRRQRPALHQGVDNGGAGSAGQQLSHRSEVCRHGWRAYAIHTSAPAEPSRT